MEDIQPLDVAPFQPQVQHQQFQFSPGKAVSEVKHDKYLVKNIPLNIHQMAMINQFLKFGNIIEFYYKSVVSDSQEGVIRFSEALQLPSCIGDFVI